MAQVTATKDTYTRNTTDNLNTVVNLVVNVSGINTPRKLGASVAFKSDFDAGKPAWFDIPYFDVSQDGDILVFSSILRGIKGDVLAWMTLREPDTLKVLYETRYQIAGTSAVRVFEEPAGGTTEPVAPVKFPEKPTLPFPPETLLPPGAPGTKEKIASDSPILASLFGWLEKGAEVALKGIGSFEDIAKVLEEKVMSQITAQMTPKEAAAAALKITVGVLGAASAAVTVGAAIDATHPFKKWGGSEVVTTALGLLGVDNLVAPFIREPYTVGILKPYKRYVNSLYMSEDAGIQDAIKFEQRQLYEKENVIETSKEFKKDVAEDNYGPELANKIYTASLSLPSRIELRQMVKAGSITRAELIEVLTIKGTHPAFIERIADGYMSYAAPAAPPAAAVPKPAKTTIKISSTPSSSPIFLDGKFTYKLTPESIEVSAGKHTVEVTQTGYDAQAEEIDVPEGVAAEVNFKLNKL